MGYKRTSNIADREEQLQNAISAFQKQEFTSIRAAANAFGVNRDTMSRRMAGGLSRAQAAELNQILSNAEERTLVRWISRYTYAGSPITPALFLEMAELIRYKRVRHTSRNSSSTKILVPIGHE